MAQRRLDLRLSILVTDLDEDTRAELSRDLLLNDIEEPEELPMLEDYNDPAEIGNLVADFIDPENVTEMFAGSEIYLTLHSAQMLGAEWMGDDRHGDDPINLAGSGSVPIEPRKG